VPLLFKHSIAGAVARAIEHHHGQDFENVFAIAAIYAPQSVVKARVESYTAACRASKADRARMNECEAHAIAGLSPARRVELLP